MKLPNFFLIGAPKAGTTSLYRYLDQHPQIYMSPIKEPHYFADEMRIDRLGDKMKAQAAARAEAQRAYLDGPVIERFSGGHIDAWSDYIKLFAAAGDERAIGEASACYLWSASAPVNIAKKIPQARILVVLRNPVDRAFAQYVHMLSVASRRISFAGYMDASLRSEGRQNQRILSLS